MDIPGRDGPYKPLTERESEVLARICQGQTNRQIASSMFITRDTVKTHIRNLNAKLGAENRQQAIELARQWGLIEADTSAPARPKHNLPGLTTPFIGRERELDDLAGLIADPDVRLITILAPGGMGKTWLAQAVARQQVENFPDGVWFVPLAPLTAPDQIIPAIANAPGYTFQQDGREPQQQLYDYFSEKTALLLLDNFEHLLDGASVISQLLQAAPRVQVMATSRERLNLRSETLYTVSGMVFPDWETPEDLSGYDAAQLLLQSARQMLPEFSLQADDLKYVARICRLTEGMPLAIVLAAAWVEVLSLQEVAEEISQNIDFLTAEMRDVPRRQWSIQAVFEPTWKRLTEAERAVFRRFSVFRGSCSRQAAQAITGASLAQLQTLLNKALLSRNIEGRYAMHELLRQYATAKLEEAGDTQIVRETHSVYYLNALVEREADIKGRRQQEALDEIQADFENVRAGWLWAVQEKAYDYINSAVESLFIFCSFRSYGQEERMALFKVAVEQLAPAGEAGAHPVWGRVLCRSGDLYSGGNPNHLETALALAYRYEDQAEIAHCLREMSQLAQTERDYTTALSYLEQSLSLFQELSDDFNSAQTSSRLAFCHGTMGNPEPAIESSRQGLDMSRKAGDDYSASRCLFFMGWNIWLTGDGDEGERHLQEALALSLKTNDRMNITLNKGTLGWFAMQKGDFEHGIALGDEALAIGRDIHYRDGIGIALILLGIVANLEEDYEEGRRLCQESRLVLAPNPWMTDVAYMGLFMAARGLEDEKAMQDYHRLILPARGGAKRTFRFPVLSSAIMLAYRGEAERVVELLGLYFALPAHITGWMQKWPLLTQLRTDLETELGAEAYQVAWKRGVTFDVDAVSAALLAEYEG